MTPEETPLQLLIGAYLNEDLFDVYPDVMAGVDDFCHHEPALMIELVGEIDALLISAAEEDIAALLQRQGVGFVAGKQGYRAWLQQIADRVRAATAG